MFNPHYSLIKLNAQSFSGSDAVLKLIPLSVFDAMSDKAREAGKYLPVYVAHDPETDEETVDMTAGSFYSTFFFPKLKDGFTPSQIESVVEKITNTNCGLLIIGLKVDAAECNVVAVDEKGLYHFTRYFTIGDTVMHSFDHQGVSALRAHLLLASGWL